MQAITLQPVRLGDRKRTARGWLIISDGAIRLLLAEGPQGEVCLGSACDRRIEPGESLLSQHLRARPRCRPIITA